MNQPILCLTCLTLLSSPFSQANQTTTEPTRVIGYGKIMHIVDDKKGGRVDQYTTGFGGKLGLQTTSWHNWSLLGAYYVTDDLGLAAKDNRQTDSYMFDIDKQPYGQLGEAQLQYQTDQLTLTLGRQAINTPLIKSYDYRIIPNLYQAYRADYSAIKPIKLTLAYIDKMAGLDSLTSFKSFLSMSQQAYSSLKLNSAGQVDSGGTLLDISQVIGDQGVWLAGLEYDAPVRVRIWNSYGIDMANTLYIDSRFQQKVGQNSSLIYEAQAYQVNGIGSFQHYLKHKNLNANYHLWGLKLSWQTPGLVPSIAYNEFGGQTNSMTLFGNWGGYPEFVSMPFMSSEQNSVSPLIGAKLAKLGLMVDLAAYGYRGKRLILGTSWIDINERIQTHTDTQVQSLIYLNKLTTKLTARLMIEQRQSANPRYDNDYLTLGIRYDL